MDFGCMPHNMDICKIYQTIWLYARYILDNMDIRHIYTRYYGFMRARYMRIYKIHARYHKMPYIYIPENKDICKKCIR